VTTVAPTDIARLAGVGKAAVSNWRRRFPDFPTPVGGSETSPEFALDEIEQWLAAHGKGFDMSASDRAWQQINSAVDRLQLSDVVGWLGAYLAVLDRDPDRAGAAARSGSASVISSVLVDVLPDIDGALLRDFDPRWTPFLSLAGDAAGTDGVKRTFSVLSERYFEAHTRRLSATPAELAELMARIVGTVGTVLDPACGTGNLLLAAHAERAVGRDANPTIARLAAVRLLHQGADSSVTSDDSLRKPPHDELADAVVCDPPFNERSWGYDELVSDPRWEFGLPPRREPELAWVQHCLASVRPGGLVAIMMPAVAASRRPGRRIRSNLLRAGALRAVIRLPSSLTGTVPAPDLWVLRRPSQDDMDPGDLLVIDASDDISIVEREWAAFTSGESGGSGTTQRVRVIDLLDDEVDVSPQRRSGQDRASAEDVNRHGRQLVAALSTLRSRVPVLVAARSTDSAMSTLDELIKVGAVAVHQAPLRTVVDHGAIPLITAKDLVVGGPPSGRTEDVPGAVRVLPGDVVVSSSVAGNRYDVVVRVARDADALLGPRLVLYRPNQERVDSEFLAGCLRAAAADRTRPGMSSARLNPRYAPVPRLPLAEQRERGAAFRQLAELDDLLDKTTTLGAAFVRRGLIGLASGEFRVDPPGYGSDE
jgi:hypothetical protein